jgi:hypothetical protein
MKNEKVFSAKFIPVCVIFLLFFLFTFNRRPAYAVEVGDTLNVPISFTASETVTAADFTVSVSGGTLNSLGCGGSGFTDLGTSSGNQCVVFSTTGATSGIIATAVITADTEGSLVVTAAGDLSTAQGQAPTSSEFNGGTYTVTAASTATPTSTVTSTPTTTPTATPTPTMTPRATFTDTPTPTPNTAATSTPTTAASVTSKFTSTPTTILPVSGTLSDSFGFIAISLVFSVLGIVLLVKT